MADQIFPLRVPTDIGVIVRKLDPERTKDEREQLEYEFSNGREFRRDYRATAIYAAILEDDYGNPVLDDYGRSIPV